MKLKLLFALATFFLINNSFAQIRNCGTMDLVKQNSMLDPVYKQAYEQFQNNAMLSTAKQALADTLTIPVVVHVLYNKSVENISDARIFSQIKVLNNDFHRTNADAGNTPFVIQAAAGGIAIKLVMANIDLNGKPFNGITRNYTSVAGFESNDAMKRNSSGGVDAWDAKSYLNIWVCNLKDDLLGFAQYPGGPAATDGLVIDYEAMGVGGSAPYNLGRTCTHELGHYFGLYHIWGDEDNCAMDDYVDDTPLQATSTKGCPKFPLYDKCTSGGNGIYFMNYLDYTTDACMNMFTKGQITRMTNSILTYRLAFKASRAYNGIADSKSLGEIKIVDEGEGKFQCIFASASQVPHSISAYSVIGQKLWTESIYPAKRTFEFSLSDCVPGMYIIKAENNSQTFTGKVLKH